MRQGIASLETKMFVYRGSGGPHRSRRRGLCRALSTRVSKTAPGLISDRIPRSAETSRVELTMKAKLGWGPRGNYLCGNYDKPCWCEPLRSKWRPICSSGCARRSATAVHRRPGPARAPIKLLPDLDALGRLGRLFDAALPGADTVGGRRGRPRLSATAASPTAAPSKRGQSSSLVRRLLAIS